MRGMSAKSLKFVLQASASLQKSTAFSSASSRQYIVLSTEGSYGVHAQVAFVVQQRSFFSASSAAFAIEVPALLGSQYLSASHVSAVIPPHFVVSAVQHADAVQEAASLEQVVVEAAVMLVYPAAQVYVEHIAFVVQQLFFLSVSVVPAVLPAFAESQYLPVSHVSPVIPPHFVVSSSQHVEASPVAQVSDAQ